MAGRAELLFSEVLNAIRLLVERRSGSNLLNSDTEFPECRNQLADLQGMLQKEKSEFEVWYSCQMLSFLVHTERLLIGYFENMLSS